MKTNFTLAPIFADHMIFQAGNPVYIFGTCQKKREIRVLFYGKAYCFKTTDVTFRFELAPLPYLKTAFEFAVICKNQNVTIHNCLAGDVFLACGEANMAFPLRRTGETRVKENPYIRYYQVPPLPYANAHLEFPQYFSNQSGWDTCHFESAMKFSAVGYLISQQLRGELDVPIGIISCAYPDTSVFSWASMHELFDCLGVQKYLKAFRTEIAKYKSIDAYADGYNHQLPRYMEFIAALTKGIADGRPADSSLAHALSLYPDPYPPMGMKHPNRPAGCFETMMSTIVPFSFKAILFCQGESDCANNDMYEDAFKAAIKSWRRAFENPYLPIIFVQTAGDSHSSIREGANAIVREAQARCISFKNNIFMASAVDLNDEMMLHSRDKTALATRLANVVLEKLYRRGKNSMSPAFFSYQLVENQLIIYSEYNNLNLVSRSTRNLGFKVSYDGETFVDPESVALMNNQILIGGAKNIKELRYGFVNHPHCDLYSTNDLPLLPFRIILDR